MRGCDKAIRVGFIGAKSTGDFGGVESYMHELSKRIQKQNVLPNTYVPFLNGDQFSKTIYKKVSYWDLPYLRELSCAFSSIKKAKHDCDILHFQKTSGSLMRYLTDMPVVLTIHGSHRVLENNYFKKASLNLVEYLAVRSVDKVIAVTPRLRHALSQRHKVDVEYIPHGAQINPLLKPNRIRKIGLANSGYVLFLGRLTPEKGIEDLIHAFKMTNRNYQLVIAGDDPYHLKRNSFRKYLESISPKGVVFVGRVEGEMKQELFSNATAVISPQRVTGLPLTVVEAMSYGKCVVTSDVDLMNLELSNPAYKNAMVYQSGNHKQLSDIMDNELSNEKEVAKIGAMGKEFIKAHHSWDSVAKKYADIYKDLLK